MLLAEDGSDRTCTLNVLSNDIVVDEFVDSQSHVADDQAHTIFVPVQPDAPIAVSIAWQGTYQKLQMDFYVDGILRNSWTDDTFANDPEWRENCFEFSTGYSKTAAGLTEEANLIIAKRAISYHTPLKECTGGRIGTIEVVMYIACDDYEASMRNAPVNHFLNSDARIKPFYEMIDPSHSIHSRHLAPRPSLARAQQISELMTRTRPFHVWARARFVYRTAQEIDQAGLTCRYADIPINISGVHEEDRYGDPCDDLPYDDDDLEYTSIQELFQLDHHLPSTAAYEEPLLLDFEEDQGYRVKGAKRRHYETAPPKKHYPARAHRPYINSRKRRRTGFNLEPRSLTYCQQRVEVAHQTVINARAALEVAQSKLREAQLDLKGQVDKQESSLFQARTLLSHLGDPTFLD